MIAPLAFLGEFGDAVNFIFEQRESETGGTTIGGLGQIIDLTTVHLQVSLVAIGAAIILFLPLGLYLGHKGRGEFFASSISNVGRAVPIVALLALFLSFLGIGFLNVATVMFLLAIPPILTNTFVGVRQVDRDTVDAARGMGMTELQVIRKVEFPLAIPTIFAGVRLSTVAVLATATIGPLANVDTLGRPIIEPQIFGPAGQIAAALMVAVVTVAGDQIVRLVQRIVTPSGLKLEAKQAKGKQAASPLNPLRRATST